MPVVLVNSADCCIFMIKLLEASPLFWWIVEVGLVWLFQHSGPCSVKGWQPCCTAQSVLGVENMWSSPLYLLMLILGVRWCIFRDEDVCGKFAQASHQRPPCLRMLVFIVCLRGAYPCTINPVSHQQTRVRLLFCCWLPPDVPVCCCTCCLLCLQSAFGHFSDADVQMFS